MLRCSDLFLTACALIFVAAAGCGLLPVGDPAGFAVETKEGEDPPFEVRSAFADMRLDLMEVHFAIGNYDFRPKPKSIGSVGPVATAEQMLVTFALRGKRGDDRLNPVQPGEYTGPGIKWIKIHHHKRGRPLVSEFREKKGRILIERVTEDEISGSIDITGDVGKLIRGNFTAKKIR